MKSVSSQPFISVIIPTYNRADLLSQSLESLVGQSLPKDQFEVIVIDDGSSDNTSDVCRNFSQRLPLRYYRQKNSGISAAKNMGVFASCGPILLFFDDDDVADPDLLTEHIRTHSLHPEENIAVLGYTTWHPSLKISRVMDFVTNIGHFLFSYSNLKDGQELDFTYFWGGRSSCKKSLLVRHGVFNQLFRFGSEDIELGYRLSKLGLKVIYNRSAKSFMIRPLTYEQFCQRCVKQGKSQYHFSKMHPDPVIQKYCMVDDVDQKWAFVRQTLESKMARVRDIERALENSMPPADEKKLLDELGKLYWWTFTALKIKGVIEAKESDTVRQSGIDDHKDLPIPVNDIEIIRGRWRKAPPKSFERGNILIIDPFLPMYDRASGSLRLFEIMKALIRLGFQLTYIARNGEHAGVYVPLLQNMGVEVYAGDPTALQALGLDIIAPYLDVEKILRSKSFDYVILSFWHIAEYYLPMVRRNCPQSQVIIDTVDIHFLREFREAEMKKNQALLEIARRNKKRELAAYRKGDRLWVVTEEDKKAIENFVQAPIDIVPNIHKKVFWTKHYDHTSDLLFVGNFSHKPNIDAVLFFHKEVLPLIRKHMPGVKTYIVGNNPPEQIQRLNSDQFVVTGYVEDLSPYLRDARISVNPLTYGAGMKGKVGEALSWGLPVVTTSIGAEGMNLVDNDDAMIADEPEDFARKVIKLYQDRSLWEKLSRNGRRVVEQRWSQDAIQKKIDSVFLDAKHYRKKHVSLVLMVCDDGIFFKDSFPSLLTLIDTPGETIVVYRGSDQEICQRLFELKNTQIGKRDIHVLIEKPGTNLATSWNRALSLCTGEIIVLSKTPSNLDISALYSMISYAEQHPDIDILIPANILQPHPQGNMISFGENLVMPDPEHTSMHEFKVKFVPFMAARHSVIKNIGGFDAGFQNDHIGWYDFILRSSLYGHRVDSMENLQSSETGTTYTQTDRKEIPEDDRVLFDKKWCLRAPVNDIFNRYRNKNIPIELFTSLGELESAALPAYSRDARPDDSTDTQKKPDALTSIIILCCNGLKYTRQCLESIEQCTPEPHEIIIVDNASTDGTPEFLRHYAEEHDNVTLIMNDRNRGYASGNNQAIRIAHGEYVVLLNNDVVVTHGWLGRMIEHVKGLGDIGMVGPVTNAVSGAQLITSVPYGEDIDQMHAFAREIRDRYDGKIEPCMRLVGFCLLIRKEVLEIIGGLDEDYKTGNYEDDDLCMRSCIAGYRNIIARDVFVHHFGSMTFKENSIDYSATMNANRSLFLEKWKDIIYSQKADEYHVRIEKNRQVEHLVRWGETAFCKGDILRAFKIFERALRIDPHNTEALNNLGVIQWELGDREAAVETFQTVLCIKPGDPDALSNLSDAVSAGAKEVVLLPEIKNLLEKYRAYSPMPGRSARSVEGT